MTTQERSSEHPPGFAQSLTGDTSGDGTEPGGRNRRGRMCSGCPFNPAREHPPVDDDVMATIAQRIRDGEQWICHQTCDGARETSRSLLCAGAAA